MDSMPVGSRWEWEGGFSVQRGEVLDRPFMWNGTWYVGMSVTGQVYPTLERATKIVRHGTRLSNHEVLSR